SNDGDDEPDVVMACAGDIPTLETLAAVSFLRQHIPGLRIRVVNVVDLMKLQSASEHPHGLTYRRTNHNNFHVRGYKEEGTTTTPFDMTVRNELSRFHLASMAIDRIPRLQDRSARVKDIIADKLIEHREYICSRGED